jgi:hypothetical protein
LLADIFIIWASYKMYSHPIFQRLSLNDHFNEFHHISDLVKVPDVRIGHDNPACSVNMQAEQPFVADPFSVFGKNVVRLLHNGELLDGEIFYTLKKARIIIEQWRQHYTKVRPHSALNYRPPAPESTVPMDRKPTMH